jgi:uncharacterized membrane protein
MPGAATLTVWLYDSAMGAAAGEVRLKNLQQHGALTVLDAVTVTWVAGAHEPRLGHLRHETTTAATKGSVLGALLGSLLLAPALGAVAGAGVGALAQRLQGTGIDREFLEKVRERVQPGTSALVVLSTDADVDAVRPFIERGRARGDVKLMLVDLADGASDALTELLRPDGPDDSRWPDDSR